MRKKGREKRGSCRYVVVDWNFGNIGKTLNFSKFNKISKYYLFNVLFHNKILFIQYNFVFSN